MAAVPQFAGRSRTVSIPSPARIPRTVFISITMIVVASVGLLQVLQSSNAATAGYQLAALERERTALGAEVRALEAEIASTAGQDQLRQMAVQRLGMVPAQQTIRIAVEAPAPALPVLPERYVIRPPEDTGPSLAWWQQLLRVLPGFH